MSNSAIKQTSNTSTTSGPRAAAQSTTEPDVRIGDRYLDKLGLTSAAHKVEDVAQSGATILSHPIQALKDAYDTALNWFLNSSIQDAKSQSEQTEREEAKKKADASWFAYAAAQAAARRSEQNSRQDVKPS